MLLPRGATLLGFRELVVGLRVHFKYVSFNISGAVALHWRRVSNFPHWGIFGNVWE